MSIRVAFSYIFYSEITSNQIFFFFGTVCDDVQSFYNADRNRFHTCLRSEDQSSTDHLAATSKQALHARVYARPSMSGKEVRQNGGIVIPGLIIFLPVVFVDRFQFFLPYTHHKNIQSTYEI